MFGFGDSSHIPIYLLCCILHINQRFTVYCLFYLDSETLATPGTKVIKK